MRVAHTGAGRAPARKARMGCHPQASGSAACGRQQAGAERTEHSPPSRHDLHPCASAERNFVIFILSEIFYWVSQGRRAGNSNTITKSRRDAIFITAGKRQRSLRTATSAGLAHGAQTSFGAQRTPVRHAERLEQRLKKIFSQKNTYFCTHQIQQTK
jgi:hypothetical protein